MIPRKVLCSNPFLEEHFICAASQIARTPLPKKAASMDPQLHLGEPGGSRVISAVAPTALQRHQHVLLQQFISQLSLFQKQRKGSSAT